MASLNWHLKVHSNDHNFVAIDIIKRNQWSMRKFGDCAKSTRTYILKQRKYILT